MKILVVVDMQNDFITGPLGNSECQAVVSKVVDLIQSDEYDEIYVTRDTHYENYLETQEGKKLPVRHCIHGTDGWGICDEVYQAIKFSGIQYSIINKETFGSLYLGKILELDYLTEQDNLEIDFCGVCTGICVISNVMIAKSALPEAKVCVVENACACVTPESHKTAIEAMRMCQIEII